MPDLKTVLRLNALSCVGFGALFIAVPGTVAAFLGAPPAPSWLVLATGVILIGNGVHLIWASRMEQLPRSLVLYFSSGDFGWVAGSALLLVLELWVTTPAGQVAATIVALLVGALGTLQLLSLRRTATP